MSLSKGHRTKFTLRVTNFSADRFADRAKEAGLSVNEWMIRELTRVIETKVQEELPCPPPS